MAADAVPARAKRQPLRMSEDCELAKNPCANSAGNKA